MGGYSQGQLRSLIERVERLEEEKKALVGDLKEVYSEAKGHGFDVKIMRKLVRARAQEPADRQEENALMDTYMHAVGMSNESPIHRAIGALLKDPQSRGEVTEILKEIVPEGGDITLRVQGKLVRVWRDGNGQPHASEEKSPQ